MKKQLFSAALLAFLSFSFINANAQNWTGVTGTPPKVYANTTSTLVGIGTIDPFSPLSFGTGSNNTKIALYETSGGVTKLGLGYQPAQFRLHLDASTSRYSFFDAPAGTEILTVKGTGMVGIGAIAPLSPLSFGTLGNNTKVALYENGATKLGLGYQAAQFRLHLDASTSRYSFFDAPAGTEILTVKGSGNIGIGEINPTNRLVIKGGDLVVKEIAGQDDPSADVYLTDLNGNTLDLFAENGHGYLKTVGDNMNLSFGAGYLQNHFCIMANGKVGIGFPLNAVCMPADGLFGVNGTIYAKAIKVELPVSNCFPDYVFEKGYNLISLEEVEEYINKNKHLPDVPSANEVEKNGINVAEMDAVLLKKIEELTLYMITLQKEVESLKEELKNK